MQLNKRPPCYNTLSKFLISYLVSIRFKEYTALNFVWNISKEPSEIRRG